MGSTSQTNKYRRNNEIRKAPFGEYHISNQFVSWTSTDAKNQQVTVWWGTEYFHNLKSLSNKYILTTKGKGVIFQWRSLPHTTVIKWPRSMSTAKGPWNRAPPERMPWELSNASGTLLPRCRTHIHYIRQAQGEKHVTKQPACTPPKCQVLKSQGQDWRTTADWGTLKRHEK